MGLQGLQSNQAEHLQAFLFRKAQEGDHLDQ